MVLLGSSVTLEKTKSILEGDDWQAKIDYLRSLQTLDPADIPDEVQIYIIKDFFQLWDQGHSFMHNFKLQISYRLHLKGLRESLRAIEDTMMCEVGLIKNFYQPEYAEPLTMRIPWMVPGEKYGRQKVETLIRNKDEMVGNAKTFNRFRGGVDDVFTAYRKGKLTLKEEEIALFRDVLTKKFDELAKQQDPCSYPNDPAEIVKVLKKTGAPIPGNKVFRCMKKCVQNDFLLLGKIVTLEFMIKQKLEGTDKIIEEILRNESDEEIHAYLSALLQACKEGSEIPKMGQDLMLKIDDRDLERNRNRIGW